MKTLFRALLASALLLAIAAPVAAEEASPEPVLYAAPATVDLPIDSADEALAAILAAGGPFDGFIAESDELIGASATYAAEGDSEQGWTIDFTYGWGDCQAGCISAHTFSYAVDAMSGEVSYAGHEGDELPTDAPEALVNLVLMTTTGPVDDTTDTGSTAVGAEFWYLIGGGAMLIAMTLGWVVIERRKRGE
jgi:hypothetical protein